MDQEAFQLIANNIPTEPGIYKYFDSGKELLYVGKAKNLRKRVSSYFNKTLSNYKTYELVRRIQTIEFTIVNSEQDAFLLENSLIKQYQPRFNINLKDDKSYPFIVIKKENFPRVFLTRRKIPDGSEYLGPFTSVASVRELIDFIKANLGPVISGFRQDMKEAAVQMAFEKAEIIRKKIEHLENYQSHSVIVNKHITQVDVFSMYRDNNDAFINYLMVENGTIVQTHTTEAKTQLEETDEEILSFSIARLRDRFNSSAPVSYTHLRAHET